MKISLLPLLSSLFLSFFFFQISIFRLKYLVLSYCSFSFCSFALFHSSAHLRPDDSIADLAADLAFAIFSTGSYPGCSSASRNYPRAGFTVRVSRMRRPLTLAARPHRVIHRREITPLSLSLSLSHAPTRCQLPGEFTVADAPISVPELARPPVHYPWSVTGRHRHRFPSPFSADEKYSRYAKEKISSRGTSS